MPRGGKRPGAGRKKGSATKKTRKLADQVAAEGISPLEVMVEAMRAHYRDKNLDKAAAIAAQAAPYVHPRLSAVQHQGKVGVRLQIVEEIVDGDAQPDSAPAPNAKGVSPKR